MKRSTIVLIFLGAIGCGAETGQYDKGLPPKTNQVNQWQKYSCDAGNYEIDLPDTAEQWTTDFESPTYGEVICHHASASDGDGYFFSSAYNDFPRKLTEAEAQSELKHAITLPGTGANILSWTKLTIEDVPAYQVVSEKGPIYIVARFFILDAQRFFSLQVGSRVDPRKNPDRVDRFFRSFHSKTLGAGSGSRANMGS